MEGHAAFLDTSVVSSLVTYSRDDRQRIWDYIKTRWEYVISAMTIIELMVAMHEGDDIHWGDRRDRFDVLVEADESARILTIPHEYLCQHLFGAAPTPGYSENGLRNWLHVIRGAVSRYALRDVTVDGKRSRFLLEMIAADSAVVREKFVDSMGRWRLWKQTKTELTFHVDGQEWSEETPKDKEPSHLVWAGAVASQCVEATEENAKKVELVTSAAFAYYKAMWGLTKSNWKYAKDTGSWGDCEQLLYLGDQRNHIVYLDNDFKMRTAGSSQTAQLISLAEVLKGAGL
jgi:hypothetical protein